MTDGLAAFPFGLDDLLQSVLASSLAVIVVLALRPLWQRRFGAASTLLLWWLVPAALLAVLLPARSIRLDTAITGIGIASAPTAGTGARIAADDRIGGEQAVLIAWLAGALFTTAGFVRQQRRFRAQLGKLRTIAPRLQLADRSDVGPAVLGLLRPRIVLPGDFSRRFDAEQQALILAHEHSHLRRGDLFANAAATALRCIYWFNPLIHLAAVRLRHDHELASDADVLRQYPNSRRRYADTLLNAQLAVPGLPVGCLWQSSHPLKERILMLKRLPDSTATRRLGLFAALAVVTAASTAAWAMQPGQVVASGPAAAGGVAAASHRLSLTLRSGAAQSTPERSFALGEPVEFKLDDGDRHWTIAMTIDGHGAGYALNAQIDRNGQRIGDPRLLLDGAGGFAIELGDTQAGSLRIDGRIAPLSMPAEQSAGYASLRPPAYPKPAADAGIGGKVVLRVQVGADGSVRAVDVDASEPAGAFDAAAIAAVKTWRFTPARRGGAAVESTVRVPICFSMDEQATCEADHDSLDGIYIKPPGAGSAAADAATREVAALPGHDQPPRYPQSALDAKQSGKVVLNVQVLPDGSTGEITVASSEPDGVFDEASIAAARGWRFQPAVDADGKPVASWVKVPLDFDIRDDGEARPAASR